MTTPHMQGSDETSRRLLDEAIDLRIRRNMAPESAVTEQVIALWRSRSADHERIWQRVTKAHRLSGLALHTPSRTGLSRRTLLIGGAIGLAAAGWSVPRLRLRLEADHQTRTAQVMSLDLGSGTRIVLGPDSAIAVKSQSGRQEVHLLRGMGAFDISDIAGHSVVVQAPDGRRFSTTAARFDLSQEAGYLNLAVGTGTIDTTWAGPVSEGRWTRLPSGTDIGESGHFDPAMTGAWQHGTLVADAEPLAALVERIGRWMQAPVIIADPRLGAQRISGLFDIRDPEQALAAAVSPTSARLRRIGGIATVISRI